MKNEQIKEIIELIRENGISEFELEREGIRLKILREQAVPAQTVMMQEGMPVVMQSVSPEPVQAEPEKPKENLVEITSPIVGTFYRAPSPDSDPFVSEGDYVKKGTVMCIVEAMKVMNEIESHVNGQIVRINIQNAQPVEYGEVLFSIRPTD